MKAGPIAMGLAIGMLYISPAVCGDNISWMYSMVVGNTICGKSRGYNTCIYYAKDGTVRGRAGQYTATGTYKIRPDGYLCIKWNDINWYSGCSRLAPGSTGLTKSVDKNGQEVFQSRVLRGGDQSNRTK